MPTFVHLAVLLTAFAQTAPPAPPRLTIEGCQSKKFRFISLAEARALALEHGSVGQPSLAFPAAGGLEANGAFCVYSFPVLAGSEPGSKSIIITGIDRDPRPAEAERNINQTLLNIENAYWNLYGSYYQLYSREQGLRFAHETWKISRAQFKVGRISLAAVAQSEGQYNLFRSQYLQAFDNVLDNERQLRAMMGMRIDDGTRLVPSDAPSLDEKKPYWKTGLALALKKRPELYLSRKDIAAARDKLQQEKNLDIQLANAENTDHPQRVRQATLQLARAYLVHQDQELKTERFLGLYYRRMSSAYFQIKAARAQRESFTKQLQVRYELYRAGSNEPGTGNCVTLNLLLESQRFWAEALATEYQAIVTYNNALAGWEYAKGTIMKHAHVRFGEAPSEESKIVRASLREQKRTQRHVKNEPALLANTPLAVPDCCQVGNKTMAPSIPALWKCFPPLKHIAELPSVDGQSEKDTEIVLTTWKVSDIFSSPRRHGGNGKP